MADFEIVKKGYDTAQVDSFIKKLSYEHSKLTDEQLERIIQMREKTAQLEAEIAEYKKREKLVSSAIVNAVAKADEIEKVAKQKYNMELQSLKLFHIKWLSYYKQIIEKYPLDANLSEANIFNSNLAKVFDNIELEDLQEEVREIKASPTKKEPEKEQKRNKKSEAERQYEQESRRISALNSSKGVNLNAVTQSLSIDESDDRFSKVLSSFGKRFEPMDNIRDYYNASGEENIPSKQTGAEKKLEEEKTLVKNEDSVKPTKKAARTLPKEIPPSDSGFSIDEALNPNEDLMTIMKSLGIID